MNTVTIGGSPIGDGHPVVLVAEGGINANGDVEIAKRMTDAAISAGCNAIKWQKRTVDVVYTPEELAKPRESPFGKTNGDLKRGLEFDRGDYDELDAYCKSREFTWFASCWDEASVDFIAQYDPPAFKIASASLTDDNLLYHHLQYHKPIILSTGMSTVEQVDHAVNILGTDNLVIFHCVSNYPSRSEHLNLLVIPWLRERYHTVVGYSGHEVGLATSVAAVALGAAMVERHITLDRSSWGSDQSASVEPQGLARLARDIREVKSALGDGVKRIIPEEIPVMRKLRRVDSQNL